MNPEREAIMELKHFVSETLNQIIEEISAAQEQAKNMEQKSTRE